MNNQITAPNYTQIPNVIFDHWMAILSPSEFKVLLCICRKTFGWNKTADNISSRQIESTTGLSKHTVTAAIEKLILHNLIIKIKSKTADGDDAPNKFIINVVDVQNLGGGRENFALPVGQILPPGVGQILPPQKKDNTKERHTKEKPPTEVADQDANAPSPPAKAKAVSFSSKTREWLNMTDVDIAGWQESFAGIDIRGELLRMKEWILANPTTAPKSNFRAFIVRWLNKAHRDAANSAARLAQVKPQGLGKNAVDRRRRDKFGNVIPDPDKDNLDW